MKLYYSSRSPYVRFVMIAAHEAGVQDRLELDPTLVNIEVPHPVLFEHNPLCKIPTLVLDDGSAIFDSRVIAEYLDSLGGGSLVPSGGAERLTEMRRTALGIGLVDLLLSWLLERNRPEAKQQPAVIAALGLKYAKVLDELEAMADRLASEPFRMGHVAIGTALSYSDFRFSVLDWRSGRPNLAAWHASFEARPSYQSDPFFDEIAAAAAAAAVQSAAQPAR